jgi:hydrogenase maturation protease
VTGRLDTAAPHLVLGVGNELFRDEGVGIACARRVAERGVCGVEVVDGGTLGLALVPALEGRESLLILDAVLATGSAPGEVVVLDAGDLPAAQHRMCSTHQIGVLEALAAAALLGRAPGRVAAVGMVPSSLATGYGLTAPAAGALGEMVDRAMEVLAGWGVVATGHA